MDFARTLESLEQVHPGYVTGAAISAVLLYALKAVRWRWYVVTMGYRLPWRSALAVYLAGQWFSVARGADISRVLIAGRFGLPYGVAIAVSVAAATTDFCGLAWGGVVAAFWYRDYLVFVLPAAAVSVAIIWALGGRGPLGRALEKEVPEQYAPAVVLGRQLLRGQPLVGGLAISVLDALAGAGVMLFAALALGVGQVGLMLALLIYALAQIAGGLSMIPLGLGVIEASGVLLLVAVGVDPSVAAAVLVIYRLATLGAGMLLGGGGLLAIQTCRLPVAAARSPN